MRLYLNKEKNYLALVDHGKGWFTAGDDFDSGCKSIKGGSGWSVYGEKFLTLVTDKLFEWETE